MKKDLKKVISAVVATALTATTFATASFAKSFSDVSDTAKYAEAVNVLSALGIVDGYTDGTFLPDNTIKRQEAAKLIVAMQNLVSAAESRMGKTKFDDVTSSSDWATGFINIGVDRGYINGKSETKFDPMGDVKYQEVVKMIVSCMGYTEEMVKTYGGYPTGYLTIADAEGITKDCSMTPTAAATRAVVAQLIYNALKTPVVEASGLTYSQVTGGYVPNLVKQDPEADSDVKYYKTMLTNFFDAYVVEGTILATNKTDGSLKTDEVDFNIQDTEKYNDDILSTLGKQTVKVGETNAADYIDTYAVAIIQNDDDDLTFLSFVPSGKNKVVDLDAGLFDEDECALSDITGSDPFVRYYASEDATRSTKYKLSNSVMLRVNGVQVSYDDTNVKKYIINNTVGKVQLIDRYTKGNAADGKYDIINVQYFGTAQVDAVSAKKITFANSTVGRSSITLDTEDNEDLVYHIYYDGEEIAISDLQKDDVLSIAYDVETGFAKSNFFDIYVSRDVKEGKFSGKDTEDEVITVAGEKYEFVMFSDSDSFDAKAGSLTMGSEYTLYLDYFGRIWKTDVVASSAKLAVIDKYYSSNSYDNKVGLFYFPDGTYKTIEVDYKKCGFAAESDIAKKVYVGGSESNTNKTPIEERVVEYKVSSTTNKIIDMKFLNGMEADADYKSRTNAIGAVKMNDATNIIDAKGYTTKYKDGNTVSYSDLVKGSKSTFQDGIQYKVFGYGTKNSDGTYPLVIVTEGLGAYTEDTRFAVVTKALRTTTNDNGDEGYLLTALYDGEDTELFISDDADINYDVDNSKILKSSKVAITDSNYADVLGRGDIVVFQNNAKGDIDTIDIIFKASNSVDLDSYKSTVRKVFNGTSSDFIVIPADAKYWSLSWKDADPDKNTSIVSGIVVDKADSYFTLGSVDEHYVTYLDQDVTKKQGGVMDFSITADTKTYVFDFSETKKDNQFYVGASADIIKTLIPDSQIGTGSDGEYIEWDAEVDGNDVAGVNELNIAIAKVVDGDATDVFVIKGYNENEFRAILN